MRTNVEANGKTQAVVTQPIETVPSDQRQPVIGWGILVNFFPYLLIVGLVLYNVQVVIPAQRDASDGLRKATAELQKERTVRSETFRNEMEADLLHKRLIEEARKTETLRAADAILAQEEAARLAQENLKNARELNKLLKKGE